jgi:succinate dehydrogenase / fumarate reductase membrane anchor subunit
MVTKHKSLSAGYGLTAWLYQRITAVVMLVAMVAVFAIVILAKDMVGASIYTWQQFFHCTFVRIVAQLTILAVVIHAWVGIRDLWMDYVKCAALRITLYTLTVLWLAGSLIYSAVILWA